MRSRNLTIVFAGLCSPGEHAQTWEETQRMLRLHEALVTPVFRKFGGRRVKQIAGTFLLVFDSPTQAVLCAAGLQDRMRKFDAHLPEEQRLHLRIGLHLGEVRLLRGDVFGEPVNIAARIEALCAPGEVLFGESVWLSMNRGEVRAEDAGERLLKGVPEPVRLFRLQGALRPLPDLGPLPSPDAAEERDDEISRHLREAARVALRRAEDALPRFPDGARVFVGAGLAAMLAVAAFFMLARMGALP